MVEAGAVGNAPAKTCSPRSMIPVELRSVGEEYASSHKRFHVSATKVINHGHLALLFEA